MMSVCQRTQLQTSGYLENNELEVTGKEMIVVEFHKYTGTGLQRMTHTRKLLSEDLRSFLSSKIRPTKPTVTAIFDVCWTVHHCDN